MSSISPGLWFKEKINCKTSKSILIDTMVVVAANFHHRRPSSIPKRNQISQGYVPVASDDSWRNKRTEDVGTTNSVFAGRLLWMGSDSLLLPG